VIFGGYIIILPVPETPIASVQDDEKKILKTAAMFTENSTHETKKLMTDCRIQYMKQ